MHILIEEYQYEADFVRDVLHGVDALQNVEGKVSLSYVGYFYNPKLKDCVFILPKVLIDEFGRVLGKYHPEDIINLKKKDVELDKVEQKFIHEFAVWIYRAIAVYRDTNKESDIIYERQVSKLGKSSKRRSNTMLDVLLSLVQFNKEHRDFITFTIKNIHSGHNKVNWVRTISKSHAIIQNDESIYINPVNKKKQVNFDEELLIIYYSILNYISNTYGFRTEMFFDIPLIKGALFESYLNGMGKRRLKQIKCKYFSDVTLKLWDLCYAFFDCAKEINVSLNLNEYLLAKNFYIVFEAIIDELLGSREAKKSLPSELSDQKDGKLVDHLYTYRGLIEADKEEIQTYYIGDSKYYKIGGHLGENSIYKQYTYARNIIQYNIDLWRNEPETKHPVKVRDDFTEGYNILPNFFISAAMKKNEDGRIDLSYNHRDIMHLEHKDKNDILYHFENRLFDRDTLLLSRYNVNFLFVIALYAKNNSSEKEQWRNEVRKIFRDNIQKELNDKYDFYALKSVDNPISGEQFIIEHFKELQGKLYRPYEDKDVYALALEKPSPSSVNNESSDVYKLLYENFVITKIELGSNPREKLEEEIQNYNNANPYHGGNEETLPRYHIGGNLDKYFVVGMYHKPTDAWSHWDWITGKNDRGSLIYNVRLGKEREGGYVPKSKLREMKPKFAILYEDGNTSTYHVFRIHDTAVMTEDRMKRSGYKDPKGDYFIFRFDEEISLGKINLEELLKNNQHNVHGSPIYLLGKDLENYIN